MTDLHIRRGTAASAPFDLAVTQRYTGLRIVDLLPGTPIAFHTGEEEMLVLPLRGGCLVSGNSESIRLEGRADVLSRVTDFAYVPRDSNVVLESASGCRIALPAARCVRTLPMRYGAAEDVPIEVRGAGPCTRQVTNFCTPDSFETDKLSAVEVITPGGNWSSYPPHKHDELGPSEAVLEEIYYFEIDGPSGIAYQRVYSADRTVDVLAEVRTGDVVLIPAGYHGPSMAAPGYDLYYLNVLAGPAAERSMAFRDDPAHTWLRETWAEQAIDARVPMTSHVGRHQ